MFQANDKIKPQESHRISDPIYVSSIFLSFINNTCAYCILKRVESGST